MSYCISNTTADASCSNVSSYRATNVSYRDNEMQKAREIRLWHSVSRINTSAWENTAHICMKQSILSCNKVHWEISYFIPFSVRNEGERFEEDLTCMTTCRNELEIFFMTSIFFFLSFTKCVSVIILETNRWKYFIYLFIFLWSMISELLSRKSMRTLRTIILSNSHSQTSRACVMWKWLLWSSLSHDGERDTLTRTFFSKYSKLCIHIIVMDFQHDWTWIL